MSSPVFDFVISPPDPNAVVEMLYRVNDGPLRRVRADEVSPTTRSPSPSAIGSAFPSRPRTGSESLAVFDHAQHRLARESPGGWGDAQQRFRVRLPDLPEGARVRYGAVANGGGKELVTEGTHGSLPFSYRRPSPGPRFTHELEFLGTVSVTLRSPPERIGDTPQGLRVNYYITGGTCRGPKLDATIRPEGADWMLIQRDGVALPGVRTTWETTDGALLYGEYSGTFDLGENGYQRAREDRYPDTPRVQLAPRFVTSHPSYRWLNRLQCVGIGQVMMSKLLVQYDLFAVRGGAPALESAHAR